MSMTTLQVENAKPAVWTDRARDLTELCRPRISAMVLVTVALSFFVASGGSPQLAGLLHTLLGTTLVAVSSSVWNQLLERHSDAWMSRTANRPLPSGRFCIGEVLTLGLVTFIVGTVYLAITVGWQPTAWAVATWVIYVCIYTPMKPLTSWNTAVGAVAGALPILIGWSAVGTAWDWRISAMLLVLFLWQFPHFIAIAWIYRRQYRRAGLQMISVTDPTGRKAGAYAVSCAVCLLPASLLPLFHETSSVYAAAAIVLGLFQAAAAWRFRCELTESAARRLLAASIVYLPLAFAIIAVQTAL